MQEKVNLSKLSAIMQYTFRIRDYKRQQNNAIMKKQSFIAGKGKVSMRDYSNLPKEEFVKLYEALYTDEEKDEIYRITSEQINKRQGHKLSRSLLDTLCQHEKV